jgi:MtrB/PioB family decaheme-associated outer membrane protein
MNAPSAVKIVLLSTGLLAALVAAAQDEEVAALSKPASEARLGFGLVSKDNLRFGQYTGLHEKGLYPLIDFDLAGREDATGEWVLIRGRNLGLESREYRFEQLRQGDWGWFADYSQTPRYSPYIANTPVQGIGTAFLNIPYPAATSPKHDFRIKSERENLVLGASKLLAGGWELAVRFRNENKQGNRIFGRGTTGGTGGHEFTPEPIDHLTRQLDATAAYTGERLQLSGGYAGSWFANRDSALHINNQPGGPTGLGTGAGAFTPIGLPPDNQAHQLHLAGGYSLTRATRVTFKVAHSRLTQEDQFILAPSAFVPRSDLGGRVDTTQLQLGIAARPFAALSLRADLRHEDRDDKTPVYPYQVFNATTPLDAANSPTATTNGLNEPRSIKTTAGKLEASYGRLPAGLRLTAGADYEQKKRNTSDVRTVSHRYDTEEVTLRAELRRSLSETLNGALGYAHAKRDGSDWLTTTTLNGAAGSNLVNPIHLADRDRDKAKAVLDWSPLEPLSLHLLVELAHDQYSGRALGPRKGRAATYSLDAAYRLSETWQATAWASRSDTRAEQVTCESASGVGVCPNTAADPLWEARLRSLTDALGFGVRGKPSGVLQIGADLTLARDRSAFGQEPLPVPNPVGTAVPDVHYRRTILGVFADYALSNASGLRAQYVFDRFSTDDYQWSAWTFTDGTTLRQEPVQKVHFLGLSYRVEFR